MAACPKKDNQQLIVNASIADLLLPFCEAASISTKDLASVLKKRFVVSLCFANTHALHDALFPEQHMDWKNIKDLITQPSHQDWISLLALVDFVNEQPNRQMVTEFIASTLAGIKVSTQGKVLTPLETLQLCFAKAGLAPSWDILCKTLVLCNLAEIDHSAAVQQFLQQQQQPAVIDIFIKALPSCKHTPEEYTQIFIVLFQGCHVRTHQLHQAMQMHTQKRERMKKHAQMVFHAHRKPSLTHILELKSGGDIHGQQDHSEDSFLHFCNTQRLPSNANILIKQAFYYLCVLGGETKIITPDVQVLKTFIADIQHVGTPTAALRTFKERCIPTGYNWTVVLRLYLAAYCKPAAKELWRYVITLHDTGGLLCGSTETEMNTQRFVAETPFDVQVVMDVIRREEA